MKASLVLLVIISSLLLWTCDERGSQLTKTEVQIMEEGSAITKVVGSTLIKTVKRQMADGGIESGISYCNVNALAITDSVAKAQGVRVKRTALKTRNPKNEPTELERKALLQMSGKSEPQPEVDYTDDDMAVFFQPIMLQKFCETCHGTVGETMTVETNELIRNHYPKDAATGFSAGELRGMWAVYFEKTNN